MLTGALGSPLPLTVSVWMVEWKMEEAVIADGGGKPTRPGGLSGHFWAAVVKKVKQTANKS